jgi:tetratricopeptide (TPR) repeat protein
LPIEYKEAPVTGSNPWNKKPRVNVMVHQISCTNAGLGLSGTPVWEPNRGKIVGMFMAAHGSDLHKDLSNTGYVIPIESLLNYKQKAVSSKSSSLNPAKVIESGNMHYHAKDFLKAIEQYDTLINDENYKIAWLNKGQTLAAIGRHDEAVECFNMYLRLNQGRKDRRIVGEINEV